MGKIMNSGDIGYCEYEGHSTGMILTWDDHTVIDVDCQHKICGYADRCKLYQKHPVGFVQTFPNAPEL